MTTKPQITPNTQFYTLNTQLVSRTYPKVQIFTVEDYFAPNSQLYTLNSQLEPPQTKPELGI